MKKAQELTEDLNQQQVSAVTHYKGPLLVLSGAGSGKTRVIVHRIAYLIEHYGVRPDKILALTFTNKAANEMKERLNRMLPGKLKTQTPWLGTFHSLGAQFLRQYIEELDKGYDKFFTIYDQSDQEKAIKEIMVDLDISSDDFQPSMVASFINNAKHDLIGPEEFRSERVEEIDDYMLEKISRIYRRYQSKLEDWNGVDFGDLIRLPTVLFEKGLDVVEDWRDSFKFLLVDEYQDTNHGQYVLASQLAGPSDNICVVGDDDQAIFGWRGADVGNILEFEQDFPQTKVIHLSKNYRSKKPILRAANGIIENNLFRKDKEMTPHRGEGPPLLVQENRTEEEEAAFLSDQIRNLRAEGVPLGEIAVLYRVNPLSRVIEKKFMKEGIPYEVVRGTRFYERKEIKDILAYLRVICNPHDDLHLTRVINSPKRGIGRKTQEVLMERAKIKGSSIWSYIIGFEEEEVFSARQISRINSFQNLIESFLDKKPKMGLVDFVKEIISDLGYYSYLETQYDSESAEDRKNNVRELLGQMKELNSASLKLEGFLEKISLESDVDKFKDQKDKVSLLTLHSAKGLEFGYIFMVAMEDGIMPHKRSLDEGQIEEERRLCYVGLTRAKERVFFSYTASRFLHGQRFKNVPSRFLKEMPEEELVYQGHESPELVGGYHGAEVNSSDKQNNWKNFLE